VLWSSEEEALAAPRADIGLSLCASCGLIWNVWFDEKALSYGEEYENSLHFSPVFQRYSEALADRLIDRYQLEGRHVIEIGCGKGEFLASLCERGGCSGIGFDPSYAGESDGNAGGRVTFVRDVVRTGTDLGAPDLVVCRHVVEHLDDPVGTLTSVRAALGERAAAIYVEVPSAEYLLREGAVWDVIYTHVTCLSARVLGHVLERAGFHVFDHGFSFGGEYLWIEASTAQAENERQSAADGDVSTLLARFSEHAAAKRQLWAERLSELFASQQPVALWGAGAKAVTFLNVVPGGRRVDMVVDVNPRKHGRYLPGTSHVIETPDALVEARPGTVVVMNPAYRDEISQTLDDLGVTAAVMVA
jgi:SAM-dependent methyltransferase